LSRMIAMGSVADLVQSPRVKPEGDGWWVTAVGGGWWAAAAGAGTHAVVLLPIGEKVPAGRMRGAGRDHDSDGWG
jgi:hypothetical protein